MLAVAVAAGLVGGNAHAQQTGAAKSGAQQTAKPQTQATKQESEPDLINPDRPGIADGSAVIWPHRFQLEIGVQGETHSDGGTDTRLLFVPTLLRFGLNSAWELRVETNGYIQAKTTDQSGVSRTDGYAPISIGAKYHFQDGKGPRRPSLGTIVRLFAPVGSSDFGTHRWTGDLRLAADWDLTESGNWSLNPNIGVGYYEDDGGDTFTTGLAALTLNYFNRDKTLNPFVDMGLQTPEVRHGKTALIVDTGIAYIVSPSVQLDISVGTGVLGGTSPHPFWSAGISKRL